MDKINFLGKKRLNVRQTMEVWLMLVCLILSKGVFYHGWRR
uniref:Uncharacterized protein n=1 Tax=Meloidogyne enterolobii TaxID=390850 RepID=A0A6V7Y4K1_MELEN|nr:unnamed protein product [Meloidogyne enterolobii]